MRFKVTGVAALSLAALAGLALAQARASDPLKPLDSAPTCRKHGTEVQFVDTPIEAAKLAKQQEKLVFVLHVSGLFEDPKLT